MNRDLLSIHGPSPSPKRINSILFGSVAVCRVEWIGSIQWGPGPPPPFTAGNCPIAPLWLKPPPPTLESTRGYRGLFLFFPTEPRQPVTPAWQQKEDTHCKRLRTRQMPTRLQEHREFASQPPQYPHRMVAEGNQRLSINAVFGAKWFVHGMQAPFQCSEPAGSVRWPLHAIVPHPLA